MDKKNAEQLAKATALTCVRNGFLEDLHAGKVPISQAGDYSDVSVITPERTIPWNELSRKCLLIKEIGYAFSFLLDRRQHFELFRFFVIKMRLCAFTQVMQFHRA